MNIAFVISIKIWGGVKTWMLEFGAALQEKGHRVVYFSGDPRFIAEVEKSGATGYCRRFGADYNPFSIAFFHRKFREHRIDLSCMNIQKELRTAGIAAKMLKIPVVQRIGLPTDINSKLDQRLAQRFLVDEILVTCEWMKTETARRHDFVPEDKITVVYNSKPVRSLPRNQKSDPVRFVITSRPADGKGHQSLVEAFRQVRAQGYTAFSCDIFGEGPLQSRIAALISEAGLDDHIQLRGFCRNLQEELKQYDFGVLASRREGFPNTAIEYMSFALPCITTRAGGLPELVRHGENGFLFDYNDSRSLAEHLIACLEMEETTYARFSTASYRTIADRFNLETNVSQLERYFQSCVDKDRLAGGRKP